MTDRLWIIGAAFISGFNANAMCVFVFCGGVRVGCSMPRCWCLDATGGGQVLGKSAMKVWSVKFTGFYPVGACAVVVASDIHAALAHFDTEVRKAGLAPSDNDEWKEIDTTVPGVEIVLNGDY